MVDEQSRKTAERIIQLMPIIRKTITSETFHGRKDVFSLVQFNVMMILLEEGPMIMSELAKKLHSSKPNLTMLIDRMYQAGLVERHNREEDGRGSEIALTQFARKQLRGKAQELEGIFQERMTQITPEENVRLYDALGVLLEILPKMQE